jgi:hypothetical protein
MIVAEDMVGDGLADASTEKVPEALEELITGAASSSLGMLSPAVDFVLVLLAPAAAAAAFVAWLDCGCGATGDETLAAGATGLAVGLACDVVGVGVDFTVGELTAGVAER